MNTARNNRGQAMVETLLFLWVMVAVTVLFWKTNLYLEKRFAAINQHRNQELARIKGRG